MDYKNLSKEQLDEYTDLLFTKLHSEEELSNWITFFLDLQIPKETIFENSTSNPLNAIWTVYNAFLDNKSGEESPAGYILMSAREGMKCQIKGTQLLKKSGLENIENIKIGDKIWTGFSWQKVTEIFDEGLKPSIKVNIDGYPSVIGTPVHRYWCLRDGKEQWIASKDLNTSIDLICLNVNTGLKKTKVKNEEKYEIGYFLGLLVGDGGLSRMDRDNRFTLTTIDPYILKFFYSFIKKYFPERTIRNYGESIDYVVNGISCIEKLKEWGLKESYSWEKEIPTFAYSHIDAMKGFIAGVFDTDGCWDKKGDAFIEMTAKKLISEMQIALISFGIECRVRSNTKLYGLQKHPTSRLSIGQTESCKFEKLGIIFKAQKARKHLPPKIPNCKDTIPISHIKDLFDVCKKYEKRLRNRIHKKPSYRGNTYPAMSTENIKKLCIWMRENEENHLTDPKDMEVVRRYENIILNKWKKFNIEDFGNQYFYDLTVENEHSYWSNGYISHNTVSVAIIEVLLLLHFELELAHAASIESQSHIGLGYINSFLNKVEPLMEHKGWTKDSQNKRTMAFSTPSGKNPYIKVIIASSKGFNGIHCNALFIDELDLADPVALKEAKGIVSHSKNIYGKTVYLSTRKYAFGLMAQVIEKMEELNYKLLSWNIVDLIESCPTSRHLPNEPTVTRYIANNLPLKQIDQAQYDFLAITEQAKFTKLDNVNSGCIKCSLLPVCKMKLKEKPSECSGGFWKPIASVKGKFAEYDPETGEAQLLCLRPGNTGLVYPRFVSTVDAESTNVISLDKAYEELTCKIAPTKITEEILLQEIKTQEFKIDMSVDWGFRHNSVICAAAFVRDEVWLLDTFCSPHLEFSDIFEVAVKFRDRYEPERWWVDQAMPQYMVTFNKANMKCPKFGKDVPAGISSLRTKIINGTGKRQFKVINTESNKKAIYALGRHKFKLDSLGEASETPDDENLISDVCDALRYLAQNKFPIRGAGRIHHTVSEPTSSAEQIAQTTNTSFINAVQEATGVKIGPKTVATKKKNGFFFSW